jgi:transcriptional regulator with XRE-family HTH domain
MKATHPEVAAAPRVNPGETLRKVRESRDLALNDVAVQLNLTAQALRNLEAGAFDKLPGHTFARGYIRAYAKLMGMDPSRLVSDFDQYTGTDANGSSVASLARIEEPARVSQSLVKGSASSHWSLWADWAFSGGRARLHAWGLARPKRLSDMSKLRPPMALPRSTRWTSRKIRP